MKLTAFLLQLLSAQYLDNICQASLPKPTNSHHPVPITTLVNTRPIMLDQTKHPVFQYAVWDTTDNGYLGRSSGMEQAFSDKTSFILF